MAGPAGADGPSWRCLVWTRSVLDLNEWLWMNMNRSLTHKVLAKSLLINVNNCPLTSKGDYHETACGRRVGKG